MVHQYLSTITRTMIAGIALAASTAVDAAFINDTPDPFTGSTGPNPRIVLTASAGNLTLPGVGSDGATLYAATFELSNFRSAGFGDPNPAGYALYRADFSAALLDANGTSTGISMALNATTPNFGVQFNHTGGTARTNGVETGIFDMTLNMATFEGTFNNGSGNIPITVSLANTPTARVSITANSGGSGYVIDYLSPFAIDVQYSFGGGDPISVGTLSDTNGQPVPQNGPPSQNVPEPTTITLLGIGIAGFGAARRRQLKTRLLAA